jgi:hypothetical protein
MSIPINQWQWVSVGHDGKLWLHHTTTGYYRWEDRHFVVELEGLKKACPWLYQDAVKQLAEWQAKQK